MTAGEDVSFRNAAVVMQLGGVRLVLDSDRHNEGSRRNDGEYLLNDHWVLEPLLDNLHTSAAPEVTKYGGGYRNICTHMHTLTTQMQRPAYIYR